MKGNLRAFLILAVVALVVAIVRFFVKGGVEPLGVSYRVGSLIASITVVLFIGLVILFAREARMAGGRYLRAAGWFVLLTAWCETLVVAGILITVRTRALSYYQDLQTHPGRRPPDPIRHALSHGVAIIPLSIIGMALGGIVYWAAKRTRPGGASAAH